jgi:predicted type IV restriction endonuclease
MPAPAAVIKLLERFKANLESYRSGAYKEDQLRIEFLNPLFDALGWDVANAAGYAEAYKDVVHEDAVKVGSATKAPDYCFRIGGARKFFVEAKKPSVVIKDEPAPAFQLRRYAWSAKLPLSILTDFEEFAIYDCRVRPHLTDKASVGRVLYFTHEELAAKWDEFAAIFSREAVLKGSFDRYAEAAGGRKKGTAEVDDAFLEEIESWRAELAKNIALRNAKLSVRDLNFAVGRTIDRIIFLRIAEDRGIETYGALMALLNGERVYRRLVELFRKADDRYNSGLFHFQHEAEEHEPPDELTVDLKIDDGPLQHIIRRLYYPESPYEFAVLPADILGQVYEQFLGKVIRLTKEHHAKVEDKPEVKKAGGVYYTPTYIVDYIVRNTVGKLLDGRTPRDIAGSSLTRSLSRGERARVRGRPPLRILDPACGSGSFLIGAYQFLLDWYRDRYVADGPETHRKELYEGPGGEWRLVTAERKRILLAHIYGVDIDPQAVEVTKLSLLLKVLEGESGESLRKQLQIFHERALPDLGANIKCGNSLIGPDFYEGQQPGLFGDDEERRRVNAFEWRAEFPEVFGGQGAKDARNNGGFDCVVGNPPYLFITEVPEEFRSYYETRYRGVSYRFDLYGAFIERASSQLLRCGGVFGFIIPHTLLSNDSFQELRKLLAVRTSLFQVVDLGPGVFRNAKNETMLLFFERADPGATTLVQVLRSSPKAFPQPIEAFAAKQQEWALPDGSAWLVHGGSQSRKLLEKMQRSGVELGKLCTINQGLRTGNNEKYLACAARGKDWKPAAGGKEIGRYEPIPGGLFVLYRPALLDAPRKPEIFDSAAKVVVQEIRNISLPRRIVATLDLGRVFCLQSTNVINPRSSDCPEDMRYLLGVLNSTAVNTFFRRSFSGNNHIPSNQLARIPVPKADKAAHDQMVGLVERMLDLHKKLAAAKSPDEKTRLDREIKSTDAEIDRLVYELYGLTEEEIGIVEGARVHRQA